MRCSLLFVLCLAVCACSAARKAKSVRNGAFVPVLTLADDTHIPEVSVPDTVSEPFTVRGDDGKELIIMNAIKDRV